jgi:hypothetical protein
LEQTLLPALAMNHIKTLTLTALLGAMLGACSHSDLMTGDDGAMHAALEDAEAENQRHADACDSVPSMPDMRPELDRHEDSMARIMERMDESRRRMGTGSMWMGMRHCSGTSFEHMSGTLDSLHSTMSDHVSRMREAAELDAARSECAVHTDAMAEMMQSMMDDVGSMSCMG